ncbi:Mis12 protein-domain-containing protein [Podospora fimiseda]|uniref:Mis12 protein-domain-containing protein n=1 Tax=Podospora fimiseda TaxID=252190 RepID=A0AAN7BWG2_9PEZI|nr:Mis12 protein-domain-containing protein [Podospora fimiseda]
MASRSDTELLTEHFGYPPVSLLDQIINTLNALAEKALSSIESGLLNAPPTALGFRPPKYPSSSSQPYDAVTAHRQEVESGVHALETLLFASIDRDFDLFEIVVMRNVLTVSQRDLDWVVLKHYEGLDFSEMGDGISVEGVNELRRRMQSSLRLKTMLEAEKARNEGLLKEMRRLVGGGGIKIEGEKVEEGGKGKAFGFLLKELGLQGDKETPITTTGRFGVSQLEGLRGLSRELRGVMKELGKGEEDEEEEEEKDEQKDWRRERLEYIEGATRKHLENVRGLELGENGEVKGDEEDADVVIVGGGKGKKRFVSGGDGNNGGIKEVENLEKVVEILGIETPGKGKGREEEEGDAMDES